MMIAKTTIRIPDELIKELKHLAIDDNKSLGELITEALTEYIQRRESRTLVWLNTDHNNVYYSIM